MQGEAKNACLQSAWQQEREKIGRGMEMVTSHSKITTLDIFQNKKKNIFSELYQYHFSAFCRLFREPQSLLCI